MRRTALAALCIVAATTAGLTGCQAGQDKADDKSSTSAGPFAGLSGGEIAEQALKATTGASSLRMTGTFTDDEVGGDIQIDLAVNTEGECAGTLSIGGKGEAELIRTADTLYLKYDEEFLRAQSEGESAADTEAAVSMLAGKWTKMSATGQDTEDLGAFCDLDGVLDGVSGEGSAPARGKTAEVAGTPALTLTEKDGADQYTMYVATEGKPYVLRLESTSRTDPGSLTFSDYDTPVRAEKPAGEILDLDALGG